MQVRPIVGKTLGAVVTGVKLETLSDSEWLAIEDAFHKHALLVFPGQFLSPEAQATFARRLGELEFESTPFGNQIGRTTVLDLEELSGRVIEHGTPHEHYGKIVLGTDFWHSDSTYRAISAKAGMLSAHAVPSKGGETGFADMRAAFDALDPAMKERVLGLKAYHSNLFSQANDVDDFPVVDESSNLYHSKAFLRPLVKVHPVTGRLSLQIGRHAFGIPGLAHVESRQVLAELADFACRDVRVYHHRYELGDLVLWDNRCTMHRSRPFDYREPRRLIGTRVAGDASSEAALPTEDAGRAVLRDEMRQLREAVGLSVVPKRSAL